MKNEYTIFDYLKIIIKEKAVVASVTFVAVLTAAFFFSLTPTTYEGILTVEVDDIDYFLEMDSDLEIVEEENIIKIVLEGTNKDEIESILRRKVLEIEEEYEEIMQDKKERQERRINLQRKMVESLEDQLEYLQSQAVTLREMAMQERDASMIFFFFTAQERAENVKRELLRESFDLESMEKEKIDTREMVLESSSIDITKESPQPERTILLALFLGIISGILIVLFKDWWKNENAI